MENKFTTYTFKQRKGMGGVGDMEENAFTAEAIAAREERIKQLKESGEYGEEYEMSICVENDDTFDNYIAGCDPITGESYSMTIIDLSDNKK